MNWDDAFAGLLLLLSWLLILLKSGCLLLRLLIVLLLLGLLLLGLLLLYLLVLVTTLCRWWPSNALQTFSTALLLALLFLEGLQNRRLGQARRLGGRRIVKVDSDGPVGELLQLTVQRFLDVALRVQIDWRVELLMHQTSLHRGHFR